MKNKPKPITDDQHRIERLERELNQAQAALKAAEIFIKIWKPTPYQDNCECGSCQVTRALKQITVAAMPNVEN